MSSREMGSFFYRQAMENAHGDLTEIVRENNGGGGGGGSDSSYGPINYHLMSTDMLPNFEESSMTTNSSSSASLPVKPSLPLCSPDRVTGVKRRKGQAKKVICIPAPQTLGDQESNKSGSGGSVIVPSDLWAWRKYGQKPIKGSPYPRGYYRCSSSKGCPARKQVERSHSDPNMLVITYTSEHNHAWPTQRNSLAGSTRSQHSKTQNITTSTSNTPTTIARNQSPPPSTSMLEPNVTIKEETLNFDQIFDQSFAPLDLFDDFGGLDPDPMSFFLSSEEEGNNKTLMDPLSLNFFDWDATNQW